MARRREFLLPAEAKSEGERLLRELLRKQSYASLARRLGCTEAALRNYARGRTPDPQMRGKFERVLLWKEIVWDMKPVLDVYEEGDPATTRRAPATTKPRPKT